MSHKILIVDDSKIVRDVHCLTLESGGLAVDEAVNGAEALEMAVCARYGLVITDVNMPHMDGYELIRRLRALPEYESTPIVIISTEAEARDKSRGFEAGANLYVVKPARAGELLASVQMLLEETPMIQS